ncbi:MAG: PGPGW domain-containing protein [Candidatus Saccharimonadales bacterium]
MSKLDTFKKGWYKVPRAIRKPLVFIVGFAVVGAGLLMLILPGPGWLAIFLGFAILATEFAFAERVRNWLVQFLKDLIAWGKRYWHKLSHKKSSKKE